MASLLTMERCSDFETMRNGDVFAFIPATEAEVYEYHLEDSECIHDRGDATHDYVLRIPLYEILDAAWCARCHDCVLEVEVEWHGNKRREVCKKCYARHEDPMSEFF